MGEPPCKRSYVLNDYGPFCFSIMESFRSGKLVPLLFLSCFLSIILFFIPSLSYLPVCPIGCDLGSPGRGPRGSAARNRRERRGAIGRNVFKAKLRKGN